ncbi:MAG: hypothetical protein ACE5GC_02755 [Acidimicrobiia bacterium]
MHAAQAVVDCEQLRASWPAQPVNTMSALALVAVGMVFVWRGPSRLRVIGLVVTATGAGSVVFHGGPSRSTEWAHDSSLALLVLSLALVAGSRWLLTPTGAVALAVVSGLALWVAPGLAEAGTALAAVVAGGRELGAVQSRRRATLVAAAALLAIGAFFAVAGRTDGLLCRPPAWWQPHAAWHLLASAALFVYLGGRHRLSTTPIG